MTACRNCAEPILFDAFEAAWVHDRPGPDKVNCRVPFGVAEPEIGDEPSEQWREAVLMGETLLGFVDWWAEQHPRPTPPDAPESPL